MGNKNISLQTGVHFFSDLFKSWRILHHFIIDAGKCLDVSWYGLVRINKRFKFFNDLVSIKNLNADLNDTIGCRIAACCFDIYNCIRHGKRLRVQRFKSLKVVPNLDD